MKNIVYLCFAASMLLMLQASSCTKPENPKVDCTNNTTPLPQMAKDYFLFKNGSYWVYQNSTTNQFDSFYVDEFVDATGDNNQFQNGNKLKGCYEFYAYKLNGGLIGKINCVLYPLLPSNDRNYAEQTFFYDEYNNKVTGQSFAKFAFIGDSLLPTSNVLGSTINIMDSIGVDGVFFHDIIIQNSTTGVDYAQQSYFAKNIGLIQFTTNNNQTYELIKYHINQ